MPYYRADHEFQERLSKTRIGKLKYILILVWISFMALILSDDIYNAVTENSIYIAALIFGITGAVVSLYSLTFSVGQDLTLWYRDSLEKIDELEKKFTDSFEAKYVNELEKKLSVIELRYYEKGKVLDQILSLLAGRIKGNPLLNEAVENWDKPIGDIYYRKKIALAIRALKIKDDSENANIDKSFNEFEAPQEINYPTNESDLVEELWKVLDVEEKFALKMKVLTTA